MTVPACPNTAPLLHADAGPRPLWAAYQAWREHYHSCARCNAQSWFEPEPAQLCTTGREKFRGWQRLAVFTVPDKAHHPRKAGRIRTYLDTADENG